MARIPRRTNRLGCVSYELTAQQITTAAKGDGHFLQVVQSAQDFGAFRLHLPDPQSVSSIQA